MEYLEELLSRTDFFRDLKRDEDGHIVRCKIHEPFHDIVRELSRDEYKLIKDTKSGFSDLDDLGVTRQLSLTWDVDTNTIEDHSNLCFSALFCFGGLKKQDGNTTTILSNSYSKLHTLLYFGNPRSGSVKPIANLHLLHLDISNNFMNGSFSKQGKGKNSIFLLIVRIIITRII
ncbi:PREDICTED: uncharacterized protein LOC104600315 [Nelumbo nucifera]|uniref:Uncharacterized protein LOC104600315 n=1 Tax=Nelumbo nucifera TaxID=4432 RepID=A0A1U8A365_NELNU|nr:PREDICTED: uncharacterized protein LOC104600315 [Nelumbo nucifera]